jgi:hypothetical protein
MINSLWGRQSKAFDKSMSSILGHVRFKIFINDIFYSMQESSLYNYADDNTLSYEGHKLDQLITVLERDSLTLIDWFRDRPFNLNIFSSRAFFQSSIIFRRAVWQP